MGESSGFQADLLRLIGRINAGQTLEEIAAGVFGEFQAHIPCRRLGLALLAEEGTLVRTHWCHSAVGELKLGKGYQAPLAGSSLETVFQTGKPRILNDLEEYLRQHPESVSSRLIVEEGMRSSLTCPLRIEGKPIGFVFFSSTERSAYADAHIELFQGIADHLAIIIDKARTMERLKELNDLKNRFLGIAAHDLRSPLGVIKSYIEILSTDEKATFEQQKPLFDRISAVSTRMLHLIGDLLDISAIEAGQLPIELKAISTTAFLEEALLNNTPVANNKQIELKREFAADLPPIKADLRRLNQVIDNLLTNAIKFSKRGTAVTVAAEAQDGMVRFAVRDQGQGIPEAELSKLFKPFSKTSVRPTDGEKSTGLGLMIVKKIVDAHQGRIWVESVVGKGSSFLFTVPCA